MFSTDFKGTFLVSASPTILNFIQALGIPVHPEKYFHSLSLSLTSEGLITTVSYFETSSGKLVETRETYNLTAEGESHPYDTVKHIKELLGISNLARVVKLSMNIRPGEIVGADISIEFGDTAEPYPEDMLGRIRADKVVSSTFIPVQNN